jgi:hypothetical protein
LTIVEGRALSDAVHRSGRIFQIGSQQRSSPQWRYAAELVRNGRIGRLQTVKIGLPGDPAGGVETEMPVPPAFNYDMWLGSPPADRARRGGTPVVYRVPAAPHRDEAAATAAMGPREGAVRRRRRGQRDVVAAAARAVRRRRLTGVIGTAGGQGFSPDEKRGGGSRCIAGHS